MAPAKYTTTLCKENAMSLRASDAVPSSEARDRLLEVAEDEARKLDYYDAHESEHAGPVLVQSALEGLEDVAAGRVLDEAELDQLLPPLLPRLTSRPELRYPWRCNMRGRPADALIRRSARRRHLHGSVKPSTS